MIPAVTRPKRESKVDNSGEIKAYEKCNTEYTGMQTPKTEFKRKSVNIWKYIYKSNTLMYN